FPSEDPKWDPNVTEQMERLKQYQNWVVFRMRNAIPKAVNLSILYECNDIKQNEDETPTDFLNRLKEAAQKYTTLDLESVEGKAHLVYLFIGQSADDIRIKLQKEEQREDQGKFLDMAWKVYRNR
ncbi:hypothetical protein N302_10000, partial [Corvus brachyrhynchos]